MAQFRKDKKTDNWIVLAPVAEAEAAKDNGGIISVTTKSGKAQMRHVTHWSKPFDTEEGLQRYGYPCDNKPSNDHQSAQSPNYADEEPF